MNKYEYLWIIQGYYGNGWEDVYTSLYRIESKENIRLYRENENVPFRLIQRRELKNSDGRQ